VEDIDFLVYFVAENSIKLLKLGLEEKIPWAIKMFTLLNLEDLNSENVENKECVHN
jgi:hypothetical protein